MATLFTKGHLVGTLLFFLVVVIFLSFYDTKTMPAASSRTKDWNNVAPDRVDQSNLNSYKSESKTVPDFFKYLHWTNDGACEILMDFGGHIHKSSKFVGMDGQKTLCLDNAVAPDPQNCVVYSFGINNEWSFDDKMAEYGCYVFAFDPSMKVSDHERSKKVKFFRTGLGTENVDKNDKGWKMRTFPKLKSELGHDVIDILKIDIEGSEWDVLTQLLEEGALKSVKQLVVEIHVKEQDTTTERVEKYWQILSNIEQAGFVRYSSKGNPWMRYMISATGTAEILGYEIAWFNRNYKTKYSSAP